MLKKFLITAVLFCSTVLPSLALENAPSLIGGKELPGAREQIGDYQSDQISTWFQSTMIHNVINILIGWCAALAVIFIIVGAYQYLTSVGDDEQIKTGRKTIIWSLGGLALSLLAFVIVQIVTNIYLGPSAENRKSVVYNEGAIPAEVSALPNPYFKEELLPIVARFLIYGTGVVSFIVFFTAGAWLIIGWGEEESTKRAKNMIIWGITGLAFAGVSYLLVKSVLDFDYIGGKTDANIIAVSEG